MNIDHDTSLLHPTSVLFHMSSAYQNTQVRNHKYIYIYTPTLPTIGSWAGALLEFMNSIFIYVFFLLLETEELSFQYDWLWLPRLAVANYSLITLHVLGWDSFTGETSLIFQPTRRVRVCVNVMDIIFFQIS